MGKVSQILLNAQEADTNYEHAATALAQASEAMRRRPGYRPENYDLLVAEYNAAAAAYQLAMDDLHNLTVGREPSDAPQ